jgi:hypothetical protein
LPFFLPHMPYLMQSENAISASEADDMKTSTASSWLMRRDFQYLQEPSHRMCGTSKEIASLRVRCMRLCSSLT